MPLSKNMVGSAIRMVSPANDLLTYKLFEPARANVNAAMQQAATNHIFFHADTLLFYDVILFSPAAPVYYARLRGVRPSLQQQFRYRPFDIQTAIVFLAMPVQ